MPIKGLTDNKGRLPRLGELRKGSPKRKNARGQMIYGTDLDYFRFTAQDEPALEATFAEAFGPKPKRIPCFLPYTTVEENFEAYKYVFRASGTEVKCDGERVCGRREGENFVTFPEGEGPLCMEAKGCYQDGKGKMHTCSPSGMLHVIIPAIKRYGVVTVLTGSIIDIRQIHSTLIHLAELALQYGMNLTQIPVQVTRHMQSVSKPMEDGNRRRVPTSLLRLEPLPEWVSQRMVAMTTQGELLPMSPQEERLLNAAPSEEVSSQMLEGVGYEVEDSAAEPEVGDDGIYHLVKQASEWLIAAGFVDAHFQLGEVLCGLILGRRVRGVPLEELSRSDLNRIIDGLGVMMNTFPEKSHNWEFVQETADRFRSGDFTPATFVFAQAVSDWWEAQDKVGDGPAVASGPPEPEASEKPAEAPAESESKSKAAPESSSKEGEDSGEKKGGEPVMDENYGKPDDDDLPF